MQKNALVVRQWLPEWDSMTFAEDQRQQRPEPHFYLMSLRASDLRRLADIHRRSPDGPRADDLSIQRRHDGDRSKEIRRYIRDGFPVSTLGARKAADATNLRKPGWLPTAIIVNILPSGDKRGDKTLVKADEITIDEPRNGMATVHLPDDFDNDWKPKDLAPIEVIDGQHRLFAFDEDDPEDFELPVVAFKDLDVSWQAYLFWTVNIKPKRINASLAFDLYPLLREQDWLEAGEGIMVYRETRAQELTEALWSTPESPWFHRINMLGETGMKSRQPVTQAAFVRALTQTFVRAWHTRGTAIGGLFGGGVFDGEGGLDWPRLQQAAFLVAAWRYIDDAVSETDASWAVDLRERASSDSDSESLADAAFISPYSMFASDQGIRPLMGILNDLSYAAHRRIGLREWRVDDVVDDLNPAAVSSVLEEFEALPAARFLQCVATSLVTYDWRTSRTPGLDDDERLRKLAFRGSSGYKELRRQLLQHVAETAEDQEVLEAVELVTQRTS